MSEEFAGPFHRDAEEALIGSLLIDPEVRPRLADVRPEHFFIRRCGIIWRISGEMIERGEHLDLFTLSTSLDREGNLDEVGGPAWLTEIANRVPTSLGSGAYAKIVLEDAHRRGLVQAASLIAKAALDSKIPLPTIYENASGYLEHASEGQSIDGPRLWSGEELGALETQEIEWLLPGNIPNGGLVLLDADTASGKSWWAEDIGIAAATGGPAQGARFNEPVRVIYFGGDSRHATLVSRFLRLCEGRQVEPPPKFFLSTEPFNIGDAAGMAALRSMVKRIRPGLVILDVLSTYLSNIDENSSGEIAPILTSLRRVANEMRTAFLVLHHSTKAPSSTWQARIRGSSAIAASFDVVLLLEEDRGVRTLRQVKNRDADLQAPMSFRLLDDPRGGVALGWDAAMPEASDLAARIVEFLADGEERSGTNIVKGISRQKQAVLAELRRLVDAGRLNVRDDKQGKLFSVTGPTGSGGPVPLSNGKPEPVPGRTPAAIRNRFRTGHNGSKEAQ